ncbi:MAG: gliding motility-associated transport system permease protein [Verrucomicrobiota bacterium]|jgi:ABC-2 type transport system permease protein
MRAYATLVRRELGAFFVSWTGYVILAAVTFLIGFSFVLLLKSLRGEATAVPLTQLFYDYLSFWFILIILAPVITMRSFALEKASGTYETLMTTPVGDMQVVLAKFTAALLFHMIIWLPLLPCLILVRHYTSDPSAFTPGAVGSTYLGILLLGSVYMAMGVFASAITRSQISAAMVSLVAGFTLFMCSFLGAIFPTQTSGLGMFVSYVSVMDHMRDFAQGVVDLRPVMFYVSLTILFLLLTWKVVESRRWK